MSTSTAEINTSDCFSTSDSHSEESDAGASSPNPVIAHLPRGSSISLAILAGIGVLFVLYFAQAIAMPLAMAVVLALLFRPIIRKLRRFGLPDYLSAMGLLLLLVSFVGLGGSYLAAPARDWIEHAPENLRSAGEKLKIVTEPIDQLNKTSQQMGEIANGNSEEDERTRDVQTVDGLRPSTALAGESHDADSGTDLRKKLLAEKEDRSEEKPVPVEVKQPRFQTGLALFSTTGNILSQLFIIVVLAYFLLAWGDVLLNNFLHTLSTFREKRCTVELVHSVEEGISQYLLTVTCINIGLGVTIGTAMWLFGMPNPVLWGVMATLFNFVPYLGAVAGIGVVFVVALLSFDSFSYTVFIPLTYFSLTTLEGNFITPYLLGRSMSLNPILIILSLVVWSWMWGVGGAILAVPLLAIFKVSFDQFEKTRPLGILLSGSD